MLFVPSLFAFRFMHFLSFSLCICLHYDTILVLSYQSICGCCSICFFLSRMFYQCDIIVYLLLAREKSTASAHVQTYSYSSSSSSSSFPDLSFFFIILESLWIIFRFYSQNYITILTRNTQVRSVFLQAAQNFAPVTSRIFPLVHFLRKNVFLDVAQLIGNTLIAIYMLDKHRKFLPIALIILFDHSCILTFLTDRRVQLFIQ